MKYLWIDTETGGVDCKVNPILQISGIIEIDGIEKENFDFKVKPFEGQKVTKEALEVTGFTVEQIKSDFEEPEKVYADLIGILEKHISKYNKKDKFTFIGYNSRFDMDFLRAFFENNNDKYFGSWFFFPPIDVMNLSAYSLANSRDKLTNFKLQTVFEALGLILPSNLTWHDAKADILATKMIYEFLGGVK